MSTVNILDQIATKASASAAQKRAAMKALTAYQDLTLQAERSDLTIVEQVAHPVAIDTDFALFVLSGRGTTYDDLKHMRDMVEDVHSLGTVTIVTAGRKNLEIEAAKLASYRKLPYIEIGAVWNRPNANGTTTRMPNAHGTRNKRLRELVEVYLAQGGRAAVLTYGTESPSDSIHKILVDAGCVVPQPKAEPVAPSTPIVMEAS